MGTYLVIREQERGCDNTYGCGLSVFVAKKCANECAALDAALVAWGWDESPPLKFAPKLVTIYAVEANDRGETFKEWLDSKACEADQVQEEGS